MQETVRPPGAQQKPPKAASEPAEAGLGETRTDAKHIDAAAEARACLADGLPLWHWRGSFLRWHGQAYREIRQAEVRGYVIRHLNRSYCRVGRSKASDVMDQLCAQSILPDDWEPPVWLGEPPRDWPAHEILPTKSALVHLPSLIGSMDCTLDPTPRFFSTHALDYEFSLDAPRPDRWLSFLQELWPDDQQSVGTLQEWFGYCLMPETRLQKMLLLIGPRRSGKGTIARVQRALIGPSNVAGPTLASFGTNFGLSPLIGRALAIISDARLSSRSDQAVVVERLLSITGEDSLTIDRKYREPWTGKLPTRLMLFTNELPTMTDSSGALVGRMILLRLTESFFGREDPRLTDTLLLELPGILLWAIEGWRRLRDRGHFEQPDCALELLGELSDLGSPVGQFVRDCCVVGPAYSVTVADLYSRWRAWCHQIGRRYAGTQQSFGRDLLAAVPTIRRRQLREGERRYRVYEGIGLCGK